MSRLFALAALCASCSAFVVMPAAAPALRPRVAASPSISMVDAGHAVDAASQLMALSAPIPAYSIPKAIVMVVSNVLVISTMTIQGKGLVKGTPHDEMVESFGITWLLAGTALGHIVGAGAILGISTAGLL